MCLHSYEDQPSSERLCGGSHVVQTRDPHWRDLGPLAHSRENVTELKVKQKKELLGVKSAVAPVLHSLLDSSCATPHQRTRGLLKNALVR